MRIEQQNTTLPVVNVDVGNDEPDKHQTGKHGDLFPSNIRAIFGGPSNCGKTSALMTLIFNEYGLKFENLYVYSKSLYQPKYEFLRKVFKQLENEIDYNEFRENEDVISPEDVKTNSVIVFDDVPVREQSKITEFFSMGRHKHVDSFYLCQTYASALKHRLRDNANVIALWKQDETNLRHVYEEHVNTDMPYPKFKEMCGLCWSGSENSKHDFIMIVKDMDIDKGRYRKNFDQFIYM